MMTPPSDKFSNSASIRKKRICVSNGHHNNRDHGAKRIRRSDSTSSHKENNGPRCRKRRASKRHTLFPLCSVHLMNSLIEDSASPSTPIKMQNVSTNKVRRATLPTCSYSLRSHDPPRRALRSNSHIGNQTVLNTVKPRRNSTLSSHGSGRNSAGASLSRSNFTINSQTNKEDLENSLSSLLAPLRLSSGGRDQKAKLKRPKTRRMEFCLQELVQSSNCCPIVESPSPVLNQSADADPLQELLQLCRQVEVKSFDEYFGRTLSTNLVKIGEGVYGEVFRYVKGNVIKVFPVDGEQLVNGEKQMEFSDVFSEVFVSKKMSELSFKYKLNRSVNFAQLKKATVVEGKLPVILSESWRTYENQKGSDNECPDFLPSEQLWMVLEFEFAGDPLANTRFNTWREARSVVEQIAISLAAAESALQFEHRDLHWHNVLIRSTPQWKLRYRVDGVRYAVVTEGIHVTLIDFTVSRLCHDGNVVYVDMSDSPEIFECVGDYQYDIYRIMREKNGDNWRRFNPVSNLYWLHYLMGKLLNETKYPRHDPDSNAIESELRTLYEGILSGNYTSAAQLVHSNFYFDSCRIG
uniref:non-specific serine/threonine protein kinase n=1 Tax=Trichobilharzia regenti TaxID=157069 RepID=A0AA85JN30_TRIRE|nr:unnamed protein product [Trichobilharzia regenti]